MQPIQQEFWERQRSVLERLSMLAPGLDEILTGASWLSVVEKLGYRYPCDGDGKNSPRLPYQSLQHPTRLGPFPRGHLTHGPPASHHSSDVHQMCCWGVGDELGMTRMSLEFSLCL